MIDMLNALEAKNDNIRSEMTANYISNPTATSQVLTNYIQQRIVYQIHQEGPSPEVVLAAKSHMETCYVLNGKHLRQDQDRNETKVYFVRMRLGMDKIRGRRKERSLESKDESSVI